MDGRFLVGALVISSVLAGVLLFFTTNHAYYKEVRLTDANTGIVDDPRSTNPSENLIEGEIGQRKDMLITTIRLTARADGRLQPIPVTGFSGIDALTSPLKFRGCFRVGYSLAELVESFSLATRPTPLRPPSWFDCFDTKSLTRDLGEGRAIAFLGERDIVPGVDRLVAVYPDQKAFAWHQLNATVAR